MTHHFIQRLLAVTTLSVAGLLTACGGSSTVSPLEPTKVIAFGDGFNAVDAATGYGVNTVLADKTTDNPDDTIAGRLAYAKYGIKLTSGKGISYANGLARIQTATTPAGGVSLEKQVDDFLTANPKVGEKDLIIITAGALDIFDAFYAKTDLSAPVASLLAVIKRLTDAGAQYVLVVYPPNMGRTPWAYGLSDAERASIQALTYDTGTDCASFSCRATVGLNKQYPATAAHQPVLIADLVGYSNLVTGTTGTNSVNGRKGTGDSNTFVSYGVTNPDVPACLNVDVTAAPAATLANCNITNGVASGTNNGWSGVAWDYKYSVFADNIYFAPYVNRAFGDYIYNVTMFRAGWR